MSWDRSIGRPEPVAALDRIREIECGEPLVDLRVAAPTAVIAREQTIPWARERVAAMVEVAAQTLAPDFSLGVTEAWRPLSRQQMIYEHMERWAREAYPDREGASLRRTVNRFVAPLGRKAPPGHTTGAAIDLVLLTPSREIIDVSAPFDRLRGAPTFVYGLDPVAREHRMRVYEAMTRAGFSNCRDEWWHYSFGDAGWAVRLGLSECFYGLIELPLHEYQKQEELARKAMAERENPFLHLVQGAR